MLRFPRCVYREALSKHMKEVKMTPAKLEALLPAVASMAAEELIVDRAEGPGYLRGQHAPRGCRKYDASR